MIGLRTSAEADNAPSMDPDGRDADLVARATLGDTQAFALLYRRYLPRVYDFTASRLATRAEAEDATQTIFLKALHSLHTCRDPEHFAGWLFAIARNVVTDTYRTGRGPTTSLDDAADLPDPGISPEASALHAEWARDLDRMRQHCLGASDRDLLDLRLQGLTDREIAIALNRSHGAVRTAQHRMVKRLRACLDRLREASHVQV
ncbi:MAG: sigma-70 family RNA polymerase sigma factor [Thermomicrobiales bacterium]